MTIQRNILFYPDKEKDKEDARLKCRVRWNGETIYIATGHRVYPDKWEPSVQRCRAKTRHGKMQTPAATVNRDLQDIEDYINRTFERFESEDAIPTKEQFRAEYDRLTGKGKENPDVIFPAYDAYVNEGNTLGKWTEATNKKLRTIRKHLTDISPNLTFRELDKGGFKRVMEHFNGLKGRSSSYDEKGKRIKTDGLSNYTINRDVSIIRTFLKWAAENGWCEPSDFLRVRDKMKTAPKTVVFLKWDELMKVYSHDFSDSPSLAQVRDVFCFCCFTSLRYSDAKALRRSDVHDEYITVVTQKTNDRLTIDLNKYAREILERYPHPMAEGKALPVISNQKMNEYLKEIGRQCGIDEPVTLVEYRGSRRMEIVQPKWKVLSTHAARRTFICNALSLGIAPNVIMKWTGHSDYSAMRPYIDIADDVRKNAMSEFDRM